MSYNVYLSGHIDETEKPGEWRNKVKEDWKEDPKIEFTDPVEKFPEYDDNEREVVWWCIIQAVICDGLFVRWDNETLTVGTIVEITIAFLFHNPAVIYYEGDDNDLSPYLKLLTISIYDTEGAAMSRLKQEMNKYIKTPL